MGLGDLWFWGKETVSFYSYHYIKMDQHSDIIDEHLSYRSENRKHIGRIGQVVVVTFIVFCLMQILQKYVPENLLYWADGISVVGLISLIIMVVNSILIPTFLDKIDPKLSIIRIMVVTGFILFSMDFFIKFFLNLIFFESGLSMNYMWLLRTSGLFSLMLIPIAQIRIYKLRKRRVWFPVLMLILYFVVFGTFQEQILDWVWS